MTTSQKTLIGVLVLLIVLLGAGVFLARKSGSSVVTQGGTSSFPESSSSTSGETTNNTTISRVTGNETATSSALASSPSGAFVPILKKLSQNAIAGAAALPGKVPFVRYIERETGHVIDISPVTLETTTVSNTTLPKTQTATWSPKGDFVILRTLGSKGLTNTAYAVPSAAGKEGTLVPFTFPKNATEIVFSPDSNKVFTLEQNGLGVSGKLIDLTTLAQKQIFSSALAEWTLSWTNPKALTLTTKPSFGIGGFAVSLDEKGIQTNLLSNHPGLATLATPTGEHLLYSESDTRGLITYLFNTKTNESGEYDINTLPEKCVASRIDKEFFYCAGPTAWPKGELPDDWYKGLLHTDDQILGGGPGYDTELVIGNKADRGGEALEATNLFLNETEQFLYFTNKRDGTLWSVQLYR